MEAPMSDSENDDRTEAQGRAEAQDCLLRLPQRIEVRWSKGWYAGTVTARRDDLGEKGEARVLHKVQYDDGDVQWDDLKEQVWKISEQYQELSITCAISRDPLKDPARSEYCTHLPCCNYDALRAYADARRVCPVSGCAACILRPRLMIVRDKDLADRLAKVRSCHGDVDSVWINQQDGSIRPQAVLHEAGGVRLQMSLKSKTGYKGVWKKKGKEKFRASSNKYGETVHLGTYSTAVDAAQAVAHYEANEDHEEGAAPEVVTEAQGIRLHLSSTSSTGYKGVSQKGNTNRFEAYTHEFYHKIYLGCFDTAVDAALAVARRGTVDAEEDEVEEDEEDGGDDDEQGARSEVVAEAHDIPLHLSDKSRTGYKGVVQLPGGKFQASRWASGQYIYIGRFDTAVDAALEIAHHVTTERGIDDHEEDVTGELLTEVEGVRLHLSPENRTGYVGVVRKRNKFQAFGRVSGRRVHLGMYDTGMSPKAPTRDAQIARIQGTDYVAPLAADSCRCGALRRTSQDGWRCR